MPGSADGKGRRINPPVFVSDAARIVGDMEIGEGFLNTPHL